ncbi:MAG: porphobilinogen synthase [Candidatus Thermoplasmatota archaeon]|nr:porphobilinogen synthase [Candidatus Thermoplasmatota archaeon]
MYPKIRMRRLRSSPLVRAMVTEYDLSPSNFVLPLFVKEGLEGKAIPIPSMPGVFQHSLDSLVEECHRASELGVPTVILFGIPKKRDPVGSEAYNPKGIVPTAVRAIKEELEERLLVACDVCLCGYTDHGHCAPIDGEEILNDEGVKLLAEASVQYARAGADIIAPSDMMDGRVKAIRSRLSEEGHDETIIISYAVKFASSFYGPFREASESGFEAGPKDRKSHQMDPANLSQAFREVELDIEEGADIVMVKPALPYLDVIRALSQRYPVPLAAFQVSGEYAMLKAAAQNGWIDETKCMLETLLAIRRAGATLTITYFAKEAAEAVR